MKTTAIWALVILNAMLLASLVWNRLPSNVAEAQAPRRPGDYLMIPVDFQGARTGVVVVLDSTNGDLAAIATDDQNARNTRMSGMRPIKLTDLFDRAGGGRSR